MEYRKFGRGFVAGAARLCADLECELASSEAAEQAGDWLTDGGDIERTAWQRNEYLLSTTSVKNMKLLWKTKLDNEPRQMHTLLPVLIASR